MNNYNVVYATDDSFSVVLGTSLYSLLSNNLDADLINIFILDGGIESENRDHISEICSNFRYTSLYWVPMGTISKKIGIDVKTDRGSVSQFSRLFIGDVLSDDIERVLYLDCDTLVVSSLSELWNMDLNGNIISALSDAFSKYYRENIGLKKTTSCSTRVYY